MVERAGVVAQHIPIPDTDASSFSNDDAARLERLECLRHGFGAGLDAEVGAGRAQRVDDRVGARFEVAARESGSTLTLIDTIDELGKAARDGAGWHVCLDALEHALDGTDAPSMPEQWSAVHEDYVKKFGPEASTIGPPKGW